MSNNQNLKGYKKVQLGPKEIEIPEDWDFENINQMVDEIKDGGTPSRKKEKYFGGNINWAVIEDIKPEIRDTKEKITKEGLENSSAKIWPKYSVILSFGASIGEVGINKVPLATKQGIAGMIPNKEKVIGNFLFYLFQNNKRILLNYSQGSTVKEVRPKTLKKIRFPLPPLEEQEKIAEILSTVDENIQKTDEIIEKTKKVKKGLMQDLLTKGIGHDEFKKLKFGPKTLEIPAKWKTLPVGNFTKKTKGSRPSKLFENGGEDRIPYLSVGHMRGDGETKWCSKNDKSAVKVGEDDITMIWDGSYSGFVFTGFKGALSSTMVKLSLSDNIEDRYLYYWLKKIFPIFQSTTTGTSIPHVSGSVFKNLKLPLPPLPEQEKIAEILSTVDEKIKKEKQYKEKLQDLKKGLMQDLLTGKVRVI